MDLQPPSGPRCTPPPGPSADADPDPERPCPDSPTAAGKRRPKPSKAERELKRQKTRERVSPKEDSPKAAVTHFRLHFYDAAADESVVYCHPKTGRTHQIRLHLQWMGHPIANDPNYGEYLGANPSPPSDAAPGPDPQPALCANSHPDLTSASRTDHNPHSDPQAQAQAQAQAQLNNTRDSEATPKPNPCPSPDPQHRGPDIGDNADLTPADLKPNDGHACTASRTDSVNNTPSDLCPTISAPFASNPVLSPIQVTEQISDPTVAPAAAATPQTNSADPQGGDQTFTFESTAFKGSQTRSSEVPISELLAGCQECQSPDPLPSPASLLIYLHALCLEVELGGEKVKLETAYPEWAQQGTSNPLLSEAAGD